MQQVIDEALRQYETGRLTRRELVASLAALLAGSRAVVAQPVPIPAKTLNHVTLRVSDVNLHPQPRAVQVVGVVADVKSSSLIDGLAEAISAAVSAPFVVYGPDDTILASGTVGGGPARLDPGTYRVEVLVDPPVTFDEVVVGGGQAVDLELPSPGEDE